MIMKSHIRKRTPNISISANQRRKREMKRNQNKVTLFLLYLLVAVIVIVLGVFIKEIDQVSVLASGALGLLFFLEQDIDEAATATLEDHGRDLRGAAGGPYHLSVGHLSPFR